MSEERFDQWAIVELMGHQRMAGRVTEEQLGGSSFVRVDVPATENHQAFTRLLGSSAIYAINIVSEEVARAAAANFRPEPVHPFDLPQLRQERMTFQPDPKEVPPDPDGEDDLGF